MIWALLFSLIFSAGPDLGDYDYLSEVSINEAREILSTISNEDKTKKALAIMKSVKKEIKKAEKDINKIYGKLDRYSRQTKNNRAEVEEILVQLNARHKQFYMSLYRSWNGLKSLYPEEEWNYLLQKAEDFNSPEE